jgi:hypothetical protein
MQRKYIIVTGFMVFMMILIASCKREEFIGGTKIGDITYSEDVVLLGGEELDLISSVTENEIVFSASTKEIEMLSDLNIIVSGISDKTPYGLLRKVTGIQNDGTMVTITTTDATLPDVIKDGTAKLKIKLLEEDFTLKSKIDGILITGSDKAFDGLAVTLENFEVYRNGTRVVMLNGSIGISPEIDLTISFNLNGINAINLVTTLTKIDEITITSNGAFSGKQEIVTAEFVHSPIIIDSLVFVPEVKIICGFDGTVSGEVTSGVRQERVITSEMNYSNGKWSEGPLDNSETYDFSKPQITENSDLKIFSGPEITMLLFGVPIQTIKSTGYYSLKAQSTSSPLWRLFIGSDGLSSVFSDILGLNEDYVSNLIIQPSEIGNANGPK